MYIMFLSEDIKLRSSRKRWVWRRGHTRFGIYIFKWHSLSSKRLVLVESRSGSYEDRWRKRR